MATASPPLGRERTKSSAKSIGTVGIIGVNVDECNGGCDDDTTIAAAIYTMLEISQTADVTRGTIPQ